MKKTLGIGLLALAGALLLSFTWYFTTVNHFVQLQENVNEKWSQVQNVYQRRADLIPNLVATVKGYAKHEASVLEAVTNARAQVGKIQVNSPADLTKFEHAQDQLTGALSRLMVVSERYPDLKANQNFLALQSQLEGTENRIAIERRRFNEAAQAYNTYLREFPQSMIASSRGLKERPYFQATAAAQSVPKVQF